jgi:hypothetical protein
MSKSSLKNGYKLSPIHPPETPEVNIKCIASNNTEDEAMHTTAHIKLSLSFISIDCLICIIKYWKNIKGKMYDAVPKIPNIIVDRACPNIPDLFGKIKA